MPINIRIGEFIQNHLTKIEEYCEGNPSELENLLERDYTRQQLGLIANYPFLVSAENNNNPTRYWRMELNINGVIYYACSQFGGADMQNGQTRSQREGEVVYEYLEDKGLLLEEFTEMPIFIVGNNVIHNNEVANNRVSTHNIILYGSPGVGKTHTTNKLISLIEEGKSDREIFESIKRNEESDSINIDDIKERVKFITFHQSFGYEDFIEGFRPNKEGNIKLQDGIFKTICDDAYDNIENNHYLVIDEINRGNISKIFGELITLIEEDKRDTLEVTLPYSKKPFKIPSNLYIIGTMNSTDKSIALIDIALRRRFTFLKMKPNLALVNNDKASDIMEKLNNMITDKLGADYVLGHSYFMKIQSDDDLDFVLEYKIMPLLEEYFYGDKEGLDAILEIVNEHI